MTVMQDITPYQPPVPEPERPAPRLTPPATSRRQKVIGYGLGLLLVLVMFIAGAATLIASIRSTQSQEWASFPFSGIMASLSEAYDTVMGFAGGSYELARMGTEFVALVPELLAGRQGDTFLALLARAEQTLERLRDTSVLGVVIDPQAVADGIGALRTWLTNQEERRIAVVFANSAEMRAGGGFIGSYAEVVVRRGAVASITVRDIIDVDRVSADRTIPPVPLEPIADRWRAADANWFLSGPESGAAFLTLLNRSPVYADAPIDAVVFVSPRVVSDLLTLTGPVAAGTLQVDATNFLRVIQEEVQEGQAAGDEAPKSVLTALVPAVMRQLVGGALRNPLDVVGIVRAGFVRRDIVVYTPDIALQRVFDHLDITGGLYPTPSDFMGSYVAVAPSTIGGDKTDAVTDQRITVREQLLLDGLVDTEVAIERTHRGQEDDPWWYTEDHRSYVKVYAPLGATPTRITGHWERERVRMTYDDSFSTYAPLATVASTVRTSPALPSVDIFEETGKQVFGFWQRTARGKGTVATIAYARQFSRPFVAGDIYTFVLERQPASTSAYRIELFAPPGLTWTETGTNRYLVETTDPAGRTVIPLTLTTTP